MKNIQKTIAALVAAGLIGGVSVANAGSGKKAHMQIADASVQVNDAIQIATAAVPGKVYEAEFELEGKQAVWEVEILTAENQRVEVEIDANTGDILKQKVDD